MRVSFEWVTVQEMSNIALTYAVAGDLTAGKACSMHASSKGRRG
jgi:hypothetical protein